MDAWDTLEAHAKEMDAEAREEAVREVFDAQRILAEEYDKEGGVHKIMAQGIRDAIKFAEEPDQNGEA
jgi:hypothetical protein